MPRVQKLTHSASLVRLWPPLALIALAFVAYHNSFHAPFIFDDAMNVEQNAALRSLWPIWHTMWGPPGSGVAGRPVAQLSFAVNYAVGGMNPVGYHVTNFALHVATALLLFGIVRRTLLLAKFSGRFTDLSAAVLALVASAVWATHPIIADSVTYLSSRTEQLVGLFCLLTLYAVIRGASGATTTTTTTRARMTWYVVAVISSALATGSKEVAAGTPLLVALYDWVFLAGSWRRLVRERWGLYLALLATIALVPLNLFMADFHRRAMDAWPYMSAWDYLKVQALVLTHYLRLTLWPDALVIDYEGWLKFYKLSEVWLPGSLLLVLLIATIWGLLRRRSAAAYCGAWCFIVLAPTSSILPIPTEVGTARRMYLPLMALAALAVVALWRVLVLARDRLGVSRRATAYVGAGLALIVLGAQVERTLARNDEFNDPVSLWAVTAARQPDNPRAWSQQAGELHRAGEDDAARQAYLRCLALNPTNDKVLNNLAMIDLLRGDYATAAGYLRAAAAANPRSSSPLTNLSYIARRQGDLAESERLAREAIRLEPTRPAAHLALAETLAARGQFPAAVDGARKALDLARLTQPASVSAIEKRLADYAAGRAPESSETPEAGPGDRP
jgi:tetratricopeptide (TPR) repeat protein